jgi:hypothetical protein
MKLIPLTCGLDALIDDEDFEVVSFYRWFALDGRDGLRYAYNARVGLMHRFLMNVTDQEIKVDHRDRNTLNNQRYNLRLATISQNQGNRKRQRNSTTLIKGACFRPSGLYRSRISFKGRRYHLGDFSTPEGAMEAYKNAAQKMFGEFARLA